jgi:hypothetical protein
LGYSSRKKYVIKAWMIVFQDNSDRMPIATFITIKIEDKEAIILMEKVW